jgi:CheY-like chemotaxis protein
MEGAKTFGLRLSALLVAVLAACSLQTPLRAEENTAEIEKLFREGVDLYQQGKYSDAQRKLRDVVAREPRRDLAARLVDEAGVKVMAKMMADVRMGNEPTYIWNWYRQYQTAKKANADRMKKMASRIVDAATGEDERALLYREFAELGHYAVPSLAPYLKDATHEDQRTIARIAIARMGSRATLPVIALLGHKEVLMRENAVLVLSDIQPADPRAIPALKARIEDANEQPTVKHYAEKTLQRITGLAAADWKPAAEYYYDLANRYYLDRAGVAEEAEEVDSMIWHLNGEGDLVTSGPGPVGQYPLWAWNDQMAEDLCLQGMSIAPGNASYYPLWACIQGAQNTKVKDLLDILAETPAQNNYSAEEKKDIEVWDKKLIQTRRLAAAVGKEHMNAALRKTLGDLNKYPGHARLPQVGVFLAREIAYLDPRGDLLTAPPPEVNTVAPGSAAAVTCCGNTVQVQTHENPIRVTVSGNTVDVHALPAYKKGQTIEADAAASQEPGVSLSALIKGLDCADQNVQYACAIALADINRYPAKWIGSEKVAKVLARGVGEDRPVQILLVDESQNELNAMSQKLQDKNLNYGVTIAASGREALLVAKSFPPKDIVILADNLRRDLTVEQVMEELKADPRTRYLPVGILSRQKDRDLVKSRLGADMLLVERETAGNDLKTAVDAIVAKRATESVNKRKAEEVAEACAQRLSKIDANATYITLGDAVKNCSEALIGRKDEVRIPAAQFLGNIEGGENKDLASVKLLTVFQDGGAAVTLRRAALRSLGRVAKEGTVGATNLFDVYLKAQADPDQEIKDTAAEAFGQASRDANVISAFVHQERIDREKKEK